MMMMNSPRKRSILILSLLAIFIGAMVIPRCACTPDNPPHVPPLGDTTTVPRIAGPEFNADSAFAFTKAQCDFGPRVPGTAEHAKCAEWIVAKMKSYVDSVYVQEAPTTTMGKMVTMKNIIAQYKPERTERILLVAHWDTRYIGDRDADSTYRSKPIDGANDGASGVAVLMEIARTINEKDPNIGVEFFFFVAGDKSKNRG